MCERYDGRADMCERYDGRADMSKLISAFGDLKRKASINNHRIHAFLYKAPP